MLIKFKAILDRALSLNDDERQNLTTYSMMAGAMVLTILIAVMVWMLRYSWTTVLLAAHAERIIDGLFWIAYGLLGLMAVQIIAQAVIAIGGKMKASLGAASIEAEAESKNHDDD